MSFPSSLVLLLAVAAAAGALVGRAFSGDEPERLTEAELRSFSIDELLRERAGKGGPWHEFLRTPTLSCGVYVLPKGGKDGQSAHARDEVYHVLSGRATLTVGPEEVPVAPGSIVFVKRGIDHRFHSIEEELEVLVFFAAGTGAAGAEAGEDDRSEEEDG